MTSVRRRPLLLAHLFAAPLVRETIVGGEENKPGLAPIKQQNYGRERDVIIRTLTDAHRGLEFRSEAANNHNFLMNLTGCRVLHFTWNGDGDQEQVMFEDKKGFASPMTEDLFQSVCCSKKETLPEVVVLTAASAKLVARAFIRGGISNVVAIETSDDNTVTLEFVRAFYFSLAQGCTLQDSFDAGVHCLPDCERERCVLLPDDKKHLISPFDDAASRRFTHLNPHLPRMPCKARPANIRGRETQVQEVYAHMVQPIKVTTIKGKPGIGKTEVALQACEYARERRLFAETFFVSLKDQSTGAPVTALKDVAIRIAHAFGISSQEVQMHTEGFLGCIQQKCGFSNGVFLLVLDGCSPYFVNERNERIKLSSVVEQLCQRVSNLQYIVTVVTLVGIAKEKVVNIDRLTELAAAELFVASAPREVTVEELRGGMVVSGPQVPDAECMRLFAGGGIMAALGGRPGAIMAASGMLAERHLLRHEDDFLKEITVQLQRYETLEQEFTRQLQECPQTQSDFVIEREWGGRQARGPRAPLPVDYNGEFWWKHALEKHMAAVGAISMTIPWEALCTHSLATFFLEVLGREGRDRPLLNDDFQSLGNNRDLWDPYPPPGSVPGAVANQQSFLGSFWPWFKAATLLLKRTGYWGFQNYPVICGLSTTRLDGHKLLQGKPTGTFLLRLSSSSPGALVVMYVKRHQKVESILIREPANPAQRGKFEVDYGTETLMRASLQQLILCFDRWTHLFPDTPKHKALGHER